MPIYVYKCERCGKSLERILSPYVAKMTSRVSVACGCGGVMQRTAAGHAWTPKKWEV